MVVSKQLHPVFAFEGLKTIAGFENRIHI